MSNLTITVLKIIAIGFWIGVALHGIGSFIYEFGWSRGWDEGVEQVYKLLNLLDDEKLLLAVRSKQKGGDRYGGKDND